MRKYVLEYEHDDVLTIVLLEARNKQNAHRQAKQYVQDQSYNLELEWVHYLRSVLGFYHGKHLQW
jgi:hypothetical protein